MNGVAECTTQMGSGTDNFLHSAHWVVSLSHAPLPLNEKPDSEIRSEFRCHGMDPKLMWMPR